MLPKAAWLFMLRRQARKIRNQRRALRELERGFFNATVRWGIAVRRAEASRMAAHIELARARREFRELQQKVAIMERLN